MTKSTNSDDQHERFKEADREVGYDESEKRFDATLRLVAKPEPSATPPVDEKQAEKAGD